MKIIQLSQSGGSTQNKSAEALAEIESRHKPFEPERPRHPLGLKGGFEKEIVLGFRVKGLGFRA